MIDGGDIGWIRMCVLAGSPDSRAEAALGPSALPTGRLRFVRRDGRALLQYEWSGAGMGWFDVPMVDEDGGSGTAEVASPPVVTADLSDATGQTTFDLARRELRAGMGGEAA